MSSSDNKENDDEVEVYHRVNKLKLKAGANLHDGEGFIDTKAVERAQTVIDRKETLYKNEVEEVLKKLDEAWAKIKTGDAEQIEHGTEELYHYANHIKDLATTYDYKLMSHFGSSLREFAGKIDPSKKAHLTLVQAHLDVMMIAYKANIKDDGGEQAMELKQIVGAAIKKHF